MPDFEVTAGIRDSMDWLIKNDLRKQLVDDFVDGRPVPENCGTPCMGADCPCLFTCAETLSLSPRMLTAIAQLHDLDAGHIHCFRDGQTAYG